MITNANEILFRCSSLGHLMTESRSKSEPISETTKTHLVDVYLSAVHHRREELRSKFIEKGNKREEDSITLLSRIEKRSYKKNGVRLTNEYITGEPDLYEGNDISTASLIIDIKTSWSAHTFFRTKMAQLSKNYYWQVMGYMMLSGAKKAKVAFCLVNGTVQAIEDEKRKAAYQYGIDAESDPDYINECKQIERNHIFDIDAFKKENEYYDLKSEVDFSDSISPARYSWDYDIPMKDRVHIFEVEYDSVAVSSIVERIEQSRKWMNENLFKI